MRHRQLKECEEHSKVYIVGNIYYIYKTSRIYGSKGTPPPWGDLHSPTLAKSPGEFSSCSSQNSSNSSSSCTVASFSPDTPSTIVSATQMDYFSYQPSKTEINFTSSTTSSVSSNTASQHPFIDFAEKHYVVERSDKDHFASVHVKTNMLYHHFPNKYDNGLRKAHEWIVKKNGNNTK